MDFYRASVFHARQCALDLSRSAERRLALCQSWPLTCSVSVSTGSENQDSILLSQNSPFAKLPSTGFQGGPCTISYFRSPNTDNLRAACLTISRSLALSIPAFARSGSGAGDFSSVGEGGGDGKTSDWTRSVDTRGEVSSSLNHVLVI